MFVKNLLAQGSTFLDSCDFERENICGMVQGQGNKVDWMRVSQAPGGPNTDYSNMGKCTGENCFAVKGKHSVLKQHWHSCIKLLFSKLQFQSNLKDKSHLFPDFKQSYYQTVLAKSSGYLPRLQFFLCKTLLFCFLGQCFLDNNAKNYLPTLQPIDITTIYHITHVSSSILSLNCIYNTNPVTFGS